MKRFDDIFTKNLGKVFSDYNADHLADEGWNSFQARKKERKETEAIFILPVWGKAAALALVTGLGALILYLSVSHRSAHVNVVTLTENVPLMETPSNIKPGTTEPVPMEIAAITRPSTENYSHELTTVSPAPETDGMDRKVVAQVNTSMIALPVFSAYMASLANDTIKSEYRNNSVNYAEEGPLLTITGETEKHSRGPAFMTGLTGTMAHISDASGTTPGMSVGFYLEQKIAGRISFRPGLAIGMSSLGISNTHTNSAAFAASIPLINGITGTPESFNGQLNMVTMEIPLNIVLKLFKRRSSSVYMSAGASSIFYISEHFTGDFVNEYTQDKYNETTGATYTETKYSTVSLDNTYDAFSRMDYFGLATVSAGYSLRLGNTSMLHIEPFLQFPLNDLTSLNLRVYYTGLSMKISLGRNSY
jgi:hypothetical protein